MLAEILNAVANASRGMSLDELSRRLERDEAAIEGMLDLLVRMGKLVECNDSAYCDSCPARALCVAILPAERVYRLSGHTIGNDIYDHE